MQSPQESGRALSAMLIQILTTRRRRRQAPPVPPPPPPPPQQPKLYVVHGVHLPVQVQLGPAITTCGT